MIDPTVYGLSNEQYHHGEEERTFLSSSLLKLYGKSPRAAKFALDNPVEEKSDALRFGSLFHDLMASYADHPEDELAAIRQWTQGIAIFDPPVNEKTGKSFGTTSNPYKDSYAAFLQAVGGKMIVSREEADLAYNIANSLLRDCGATSEQVRKLLKWAKATEVSYFYENEDGIRLKVRPDLLTANKLVDWKTTALDTLDEDSIAKSIIKYGYHISMSMYQFVLHEIEGKWYTPILVFVQKNAPHDCLMVDLSEWCYNYSKEFDIDGMGVGALEFKRLLDLHTKCVKNNSWPGAENAIEADNNVRIMKPAVPVWYGQRIYNE